MFEDLLAALQATGIPFEAYAWDVAPNEDYGVVSLDGPGGTLYADNCTEEQAVSGMVDLFIHGTGLAKARTVQAALNAFDCAWKLNMIQYEQDTDNKLVHFSWDYELRCL